MVRIVHVMTVPDSLVFLRGQVAFMKTRGYDLAIVSSPGEALDRFAAREGVRAYGVAMPRSITPGRDLASVRALAGILRRERPDIVHAHTPKGGLLGMIAATIARVPSRIYHMRGLPLMTATGSRRALLTTTERVSCALASRVLCVSGSLRDVALRERLCAPAKIQVLGAGSGNGVDCDGRFAPRGPGDRRAMREALGIPEEAVVFGFVGRLARDKGVAELAEAWAAVRGRDARAHLVVVGDPEGNDPVPAEAMRAFESDPRVHLTGFTPDTPRLYAGMDVVVLPTYREGFPNVPLEAASMGLPVVATQVAGCVDAVADGVTGTLVPARSSRALAAAMEAYLVDPALRARHGQQGRARVVRDFRPSVLWGALDGVYRELARAPSAAVSASRVNEPDVDRT